MTIKTSKEKVLQRNKREIGASKKHPTKSIREGGSLQGRIFLGGTKKLRGNYTL